MPSATSPTAPITPSMNSNTVAQDPDVPPFPAPSVFSILPEIYFLISRLDLLAPPSSSSSGAPSANNATTSAAHANNSSTTTTNTGGGQLQIDPQTSFPPTTPGGSSAPLPPLSPKDLAGAAHPIKQMIQKARVAVQGLPDVERTVEEQEAEIRRLEARVKALKGRLGELGELAAKGLRDQVDRGDVVMEGVEG